MTRDDLMRRTLEVQRKLHDARRLLKDIRGNKAIFEIDTLLSVAESEIARQLSEMRSQI
jgi:hypothetical protein